MAAVGDIGAAERRHDEAAAALVTALDRAAGGEATAEDVAAALAAVAALAAARAALRAPVPAAVRAREQVLARRLEQDLLPVLARRVVAAAPVPGEPLDAAACRGTFLDLAVLLRRLSQDEGPFGRPVGRAAVGQAVGSLAHIVRYFYRTAFDRLQGPDHPDLAALSADLFRVDLIEDAVSVLGGEAEAAALRSEIAVLSREALRSTTATVRAFLAGRTPDTRLSLAAVLQAVEDLIVLVDRVATTGSADRGAFAPGLGEAAIAEFLDACAPLVVTIALDLRDRMAAGAVSPAAARGNLGQILRILRFCHGVRHPLGRHAVSQIAAVLPRLVGQTVGAAGAEATRNRALIEVLESFVAEALPLVTAEEAPLPS